MPRAPMQVLRADGMRIDLSRRDAGALLVATRQNWQQECFSYRDLIGELRYAVRLRAQSVARVRFYIAEQRAWPEDPIPLDVEGQKDAEQPSLDAQLVADAIHNFNLIPLDDRPDGFTARLDENLDIAGECWLHIDADGRFHVRSTSEVSATADGRVTISTLPTATAGSMRVLDPNTESLLRLWTPHPEYGQLADSSLRTLRDVCEDIVLAGREQRAAARSRVAANGLLLLPSSLSMLAERSDDEHDDSVTSDTFMADLTAAMLAPIRDDGDSGAVVPIVIRGEIEDLEKVRHITLQRADAEQLITRQSSAILRLLRGMDVQPEQVEGIGSTNHWTSWQIDARAIRDQVKPAAETLAACLMQAYMIPALEDLGYTRDQLDQLTIAVDTSPLSENPNRGQDARDAHTAMVIRDAALREALGFDEDDAPDEEEMVRRLATSGKLPVDAVAQIFGLRGQQESQPITIEGETTGPAALPAAEERPQASPGEVTPSRPTPAEPTQIVAAAPVPVPDPFGFVVDVDATRRLADIDAELADRIVVAADAALARILEKAGARVRSKAQKDSTLAASLVGVEAHIVPAKLGRAKVEEFASIPDLIGDGYGRLRGQFGKWMARAAEQVAEVVVDVLHLDRRSDRADAVRDQVRSRIEVRTGQAWQTLTEHMDTAAEEALFRDDPLTPDPGPGEPVDTLIRPSDVEDVLRVAGGGQPRRSSQTRAPLRSETPGPGGFGTGPDVTGLLQEQGAVLLGWEWQYRNAIHRDHKFAPWHTQLNGLRFSTFTDPKLDTDPETSWLGPYYFPGDHAGCRCRVIPLLAVPELDDGIVAQRLREAAGDPRNVLAEQVAAEDTAAGRVGTSLQQEVEVRSRITSEIERLTREHIGGSR